MLTLTVKQLRESLASFANLAGQQIKNVRLAYNLSKTLKSLQEEAKEIGEQEKKIFLAYGATEQRQPNGAVTLGIEQDALTDDQRDRFNEELTELQNMPIEVWGKPVTLAEIEAAQLTLSAHDFSVLSWLIADEEENPRAASASA